MCSQYQEPLDLAPQYGYPYNKDPHLYRPESVYSRPFIGAQHLDVRHSSTFGNEGQHYVLQNSAELGHHEICTPKSINTFNDTQHIDAFHSLTSANEDQHYMRQLPADLEDNKIYGAPRMRALLACERCRKSKMKCDEEKPRCENCAGHNETCFYKVNPPTKVDINKKMDRLQATLDALMPIRGPLANALQKSSESKTNPNFIEQSYRELTGGLVAINNTTGVHRLLQWPIIQDLLKTHSVNENYVMEMEEKEGLLRLYERGQGPSATGFNSGSMKMDWQTMTRLLTSYLKNIHSLHPFLNNLQLMHMFERVGGQYNPNGAFDAGAVSPNGSAASNAPRNAGDKPISLHVSSAIVLLVMALGRIWEHKDHLLGSTDDIQNVLLGVNSLHPNNLTKASPTAFSSSASSPIAKALPIDTEVSGQRVERTPGLAYFACTEIVME